MTMETAVIAGVGPGLGSSLARAFAREGYAVALISRRSESSEPVAEQIRSAGGEAIIIPADVTQRQAVLKSVERASAELGPITALAYNASGYGRGAFLEIEPQRSVESVIPPDAIAAAVIHTLKQPRNAWTHEIDVRPYLESF